MRVVIYPPLDSERLVRLRSAFTAIEVVNAHDEDQAVESIGAAEAFFGKMTPTILAAAHRLRWVQAPTASLEHYIFPELVQHPAVLTNMRGIHAEPIADQVMGYVISFARNLHLYVRRQLDREWAPEGGEQERSGFETGPGTVTAIDRSTRDLAGASMGIIGFGAIGHAVARRAAAFSMRIIAVDAQPQFVLPGLAGVAEVRPASALNDVLPRVDYVVVTLPHTPETVRLFDRRRFSLMKPSAIFVNVGRGAVVVLDDLVEALRAKEIEGAALDVFETEPLPSVHPLWGMENVIITPHVAGYSPTVPQRHFELFLGNIARFISGAPLLNEVDKARWY